ncbi:MAG: hypothetical protein QOF83_1966 [Solirubrobacteraceae bacterium]|nr:hypothetical protein [Solirubrobacteraceae bacterium]
MVLNPPDGHGNYATSSRQLDRERSELGASKAVVRGGAHGQLLMGELTSEQRVTVG